MKKIILLTLLILLLVSCTKKDTETLDTEEAYKKCTSVCASVLTDDFTTLHLCNEECKKRFNITST